MPNWLSNALVARPIPLIFRTLSVPTAVTKTMGWRLNLPTSFFGTTNTSFTCSNLSRNSSLLSTYTSSEAFTGCRAVEI
ncbi:hypothetical protein PR003_g35037 [Phytophthora rubi]|uniref:Uncharacterized protein n=2 Tax=Phytophthora TaxID=4783 RepID=A0A6A3GAC5_9STRA|nr:hypothetical protein PR001_g33946 [Phytophthora rubi]KAE8950946.1 hypothetical protein PR002_g33123 [Phytophthora rubi]KAE9258867.1 hypothetical protein PR003_g35037 [Phytophthora rubi]KAE9273094.1 hypothetical protein PF008_g29934 [Phytophthora fragariae]